MRKLGGTLRQALRAGLRRARLSWLLPLASSPALATGKSIYGGCLATTPWPGDMSLVTAPSGGVPAVTA
jgi:hypothetical protein